MVYISLTESNIHPLTVLFLHGCYGAFVVVVSIAVVVVTGINEIVSLYSFAVVSSLASFSFKLCKVVGFDTISVDAITVRFIVDVIIIVVVIVGDLLFCFALDFLYTHTPKEHNKNNNLALR